MQLAAVPGGVHRVQHSDVKAGPDRWTVGVERRASAGRDTKQVRRKHSCLRRCRLLVLLLIRVRPLVVSPAQSISFACAYISMFAAVSKWAYVRHGKPVLFHSTERGHGVCLGTNREEVAQVVHVYWHGDAHLHLAHVRRKRRACRLFAQSFQLSRHVLCLTVLDGRLAGRFRFGWRARAR